MHCAALCCGNNVDHCRHCAALCCGKNLWITVCAIRFYAGETMCGSIVCTMRRYAVQIMWITVCTVWLYAVQTMCGSLYALSGSMLWK